MGRRRWRFITIAAFLLFMTKDTQCQDENDFYYTPIERSFAQVQPPLYPNNRPATYFEQDTPFSRPGGPPTIATGGLYEENRVRFPAPNYNQNPSPFQLPTGRSQSGGQYYVNQPDYTPSRQRYRPALPHNYQIIHPASTKRPDISQIHSVAYQNDPSKPEAFLGQVTINNPDIEYLQNSRFKNVQFEGNSLKNNGQSNQGISNNEDVENDDQDLFERHRVTTYNPNKMSGKQRIIRPNPGRFPHYEGDPNLNDKTIFEKTPTKVYDVPSNNFKTPKTAAKSAAAYHDSSTEYKAMLDLEPLLEDDIRDIPSFRELMKNTKGSYDVQVIKSNHSDEAEKYDSNPSASSMDADNIPKEEPTEDEYLEPTKRHPTINKQLKESNEKKKQSQELEESNQDSGHESHNSNEENEEDVEYADYYDDDPTPAPSTTTPKSHSTEDYEEYDASEETDHPNADAKQDSDTKNDTKKLFDVVAMKTNNTMVKDDNFKEFVDTSVIDETEHNVENETTETNTETAISSEEVSSIDTVLGQEVVSVVTTKSVVNGTISVPDMTDSPSSTKAIVTTEISPVTPLSNDSNSSIPVTTENWIVVASVQTSRSVSGARFLPFPTVEQEEKKQVLADEKDEDEEDGEFDDVTENPKDHSDSSDGQQTTSMSTENINDKLDSIQSELSSAVLSGSLDNGNKNIEIITESTTTKQPTTTTTMKTTTTSTTTTTTTTPPPKLFTLRSTEIPVSTERLAPEPPPVLIKKFTPRVAPTSSTTTPKPKKKLVTVMDDLSGLLPAGYKPRMSYKDKRTSTTTTTTTTTTIAPLDTLTSEEENANSTQGRSSGISSKNKVIIRDNKSPFVPKDFKNKELKHRDENFDKVSQGNLSKLLPPGYKPPTESSETKDLKTSIFDKVEQLDISEFLPKGFNLTTTTTERPRPKPLLPKAVPVDLSALLPPGFKLNATEIEAPQLPIKNIKIADVSNLLPPGFTLGTTEEPIKTTSKAAPGGFKLVFPLRPGNKAGRKSTTPRTMPESGPIPVTPKIQKGWPTRASTEFTGWPSPSTTPFSIEKLLEAQRNATATSPMPDLSTEGTTRRTTTTTTTAVPTAPTTPGICKDECDIAATIKIVSGVKWVPELLDHHTEEWQNLAQEVKDELNSVYSKSDLLSKWYKGIRIDGFSQGSVLVDYIIELNDIKEKVDTIELKKLFHKSLNEASTGAYVETVTEESSEGFDPDVMLGDQPEEERMKKSNEKMTKTIDKSAGKLEIGKFVMDPAYTEFIVLPKREEITTPAPDEESFLPQWGIAVIVIAMASLLFVVIFGVTVLVNRQKSAKAKQPIPLSEDMLRELDKSHMGGFDDLHQLKEREIPYQPSGKRMSTAFIEQLAYQNPGDSWRSEWTPQLQKYMQQQHYTPDSGRGSQIYGAAGNPYGYGGGSQLYGQTGGSQLYGYTGEYPAHAPHPRHYSRRRSEYDSNF